MPRLARTSLLVLALALPACSDSSGPDGLTIFDCDEGARYSIGTTVNGAIRTSDCADPGGEGYADYYQFRLSSDGPVSVTVAAPQGGVTVYVALIDFNDDLVDIAMVAPGDDVELGGLLEEGTYVIVIGADVPGDDSRYTLSSSTDLPFSGPPFFDCTVFQAYTIGTTVNGTLADGDCLTPDEAWMDRYQFTLATARTVTIDLTSDNFDAYLYLFNSAGTVIARNDDTGSVLDSRLTISLPAGTYSIGASAFSWNSGGAYSLRVQ